MKKINLKPILIKSIKWLLHIPSLIIALVLVIHVLSSLTDDPFFTWFFRFVGIVVILSAQFFRGMAWLHKKIKLPQWRWKVFGYWFILVIYIICFEFLASVGALVSQVETIELKQETAAFVEAENREEYERIKANIETYKRYRDEENKTGKGNKFEHWDNKVVEEEAKLAKLKSKIAAVPETQKETKKSPFLSLSKVYKAPADTFKGLMIAAALLMSYITLLVTPWHLPMEILGIEPAESRGELSEVKTKVLQKASEVATKNDNVINNVSELYEPQTNGTKNDITPEQEEIIKFTEELWGDNSEEIPRELVALKNINITERKTRKYSDFLENIGAIEKGRGVPPRAMWPKEKVIDYIKTHDIAI